MRNRAPDIETLAADAERLLGWSPGPPPSLPCPCERQAQIVPAASVYGEHREDLSASFMYQCRHCRRHVGCHGFSMVPLGVPADVKTRVLREKLHHAFDSLWAMNGIDRRASYVWLARIMGIPEERCHVGMFDARTCELAIEALAHFGVDGENVSRSELRDVLRHAPLARPKRKDKGKNGRKLQRPIPWRLLRRR